MDAAWLALMNDWQHPWLTAGMGAVTWLGSLLVLLPLAVAAGWGRAGGIFLPAAVLVASGLAHAIKWLVDRERPDAYPSLIAMPADASFPSAHAMQVAALVTAWLLWSGKASRIGNLALGALLVLAVAFSRTYLQVHFLSDVLAGIAAGALCAVLLHALPFRQRAA
jgi:undecaprenyl-diphosphatase